MTINFEDVLYLADGGGVKKRTSRARSADIYNVKDFGALGTGSGELISSVYGTLAAAQAAYPLLPTLTLNDTLDWAGIQSAIYALAATPLAGGTVFIPAGQYFIKQGIEINTFSGRITGVGRNNTFITGNLPNGFVVNQSGGGRGPSEISHLSIGNSSTWIGSGGLRANNTTATTYLDMVCGGMISYLFPHNIFNSTLDGCYGGPNADSVTGTLGTLGYAGYSCNIRGWRSASAMQAAIQMSGANSASIHGCGIENCVVALLLGTITGWASHCTVAPDGLNPGFSILTVAANALMGGSAAPGGAGGPGPGGGGEFAWGSTLFGRGLAMPAWGSDPNDTTGGTTITGTKDTDPTLTGVGSQGTYRINGTYTITTPIPIWTRNTLVLSGISVSSIQTEACFHSIYVNSVSGCNITASGFGVNGNQCETQAGNGITGYTCRAPFYLREASATVISGIYSAPSHTYLAGIYIAPSANLAGVKFENCVSQKGADNIATGTITSDVMTITTFTSGASIGIGMPVTGSGVTPGTVITGSFASNPPTDTFTVTIASPAVFTTPVAHGLSVNSPIQLYNQSETLPTGLAIRTTYYVLAAGLTATAFRLGATAGGAAINTSGTQGGTHYWARLDGTNGLTGFSTTGTWRVSPGGQSVSSTTLSVATGADWVMPTSTQAKTSLRFENCSSTVPAGIASGLNSFNMTFTSLPGEAGAKSGFTRIEGQEYNIIDGALAGGGTAIFGSACQGGGTQHIKVWWNGTSWIRNG